MEIRMNCNEFIELKNYVAIAQIKVSLVDFQKEQENINGSFKIFGEYFIQDLDVTESFSHIIPFNIILNKSNYEIESIIDNDFTFYEVAGRGIETYFDIVINYRELTNDNKIEIREMNTNKDEQITNDSLNEVLEEVKDEITENVDILLSTKLEIKTDNLPTKVELFRSIPVKKKKITITF